MIRFELANHKVQKWKNMKVIMNTLAQGISCLLDNCTLFKIELSINILLSNLCTNI